jgi:hypothetical protein
MDSFFTITAEAIMTYGSKPSVNIKVTVDGKIKSRHMANQIMKEAGIDYHF